MRLPTPCARALVAGLGLEVVAAEAAQRRPRRRQVVALHQLHALAMGEAVVDGVEVGALVHLRLLALVVQHRRQRVLVGQGQLGSCSSPAPPG